MGAQVSVVAVGGVTVPASSFFNQQAVAAITNLVEGHGALVDVYSGGPVSTIAPANAGEGVLVIAQATGVSAALPSGYDAVVVGPTADATISGGGASTTVLAAGTLAYTGDAGTLLIQGARATVTATGAAASIQLDNQLGAFTVNAAAAADTVSLFNGEATIVASADRDVINLEQRTVANAPMSSPAPAADAWISAADATVNISMNNALVVDEGSASTINGNTGMATVYAGTGEVYRGSGAVVTFIGVGSAQTVFGGTGNDSIFGGSGEIQYYEGTGTSHLFVGGSGSATVTGAGSGVIWGGDGTVMYNTASGNDLLVAGGTNGSETVAGTGNAATIFACGSGNHLTLANKTSDLMVDVGSNSVLDASSGAGGDVFYVLNTAGNAVLIGADVGNEAFVLQNAGATTAHTVLVENFTSGDAMFLDGYSHADARAAIKAVEGGARSFTLSDGTTVTFAGQHPMHGSGSVLY